MGDPLAAGAQVAGDVLSGLFNAHSARKQMEFQARMSSTAYQRAARDLEAAGLNRVLALGSPASSPSGASASMAPMGPTISGAITARANARVAAENEKLLRLQQGQTAAVTEKTLAEKAYVEAQTLQSNTQSVLNEALTGWHRGQTGQLPLVGEQIKALTGQAKAGTAWNAASARLTGAEADKQEVVKRFYRVVDPLLQLLIDRLVNPLLNSAVDKALPNPGSDWYDIFKEGGLGAFKRKFNIR